MNAQEAVEALDALGPQNANREDPEMWHSRADGILLAVVPAEVAAAYEALVERSPWWACA